MRNIILITVLLASLFAAENINAQAKKIDTTAYFGEAGYRVSCTNKKEDDNFISIMPKNFKNTARDITFGVRGRLTSIIVDDLNDDGFPDLMLIVYSGPKHEIATIYGISSKENTELAQVYFPDVYSDSKLREGYKGYDEFTIVAGSLLRSYPIFKPTDTDKPTGGTRVVQYKIVTGERGGLTFKALRNYEKP
jgi:hypothetical protein